jgi:hypothetical protein
MTRPQRPCTVAVGASFTIEERSPLVGDRHADLHVGGLIAKCEAHRHLFLTMPRWPCLSGHPRTREIDPFEFLVKATYNGRCARRNLSGCRRPRLVSVQSFDQGREHVLTGSHHPNQHHELLSVPVQEPTRLPGG